MLESITAALIVFSAGYLFGYLAGRSNGKAHSLHREYAQLMANKLSDNETLTISMSVSRYGPDDDDGFDELPEPYPEDHEYSPRFSDN